MTIFKIHFSVIIQKILDNDLTSSSFVNSVHYVVVSLNKIHYHNCGTACSPLIQHRLYQSSIKAIYVEKEPVFYKSAQCPK